MARPCLKEQPLDLANHSQAKGLVSVVWLTTLLIAISGHAISSQRLEPNKDQNGPNPIA